MKKFFFFLFFTCISIIGCRAQWDSWNLNQQLNQMNMQMQIDQQQMMNALMGMMNQVAKDSKVYCSVFPTGNDTFYAMIGHPFVNPNQIEIIGRNPNGTQIRVPISSCLSANGQTMTPSVFVPGMKVIIKRNDTGEVVHEENIPSKDSSGYNNYVREGIGKSQTYNNMMNPNGMSSGQSSNSGTTGSSKGTANTCSNCHGKGWVPGNSTPTYGNTGTYRCVECDKIVAQSHSHDRCPSCR